MHTLRHTQHLDYVVTTLQSLFSSLKQTSSYGKNVQSPVAVMSRQELFRRMWFAILLESPIISHAKVSFKLC